MEEVEVMGVVKLEVSLLLTIVSRANVETKVETLGVTSTTGASENKGIVADSKLALTTEIELEDKDDEPVRVVEVEGVSEVIKNDSLVDSMISIDGVTEEEELSKVEEAEVVGKPANSVELEMGLLVVE